MDSQFCIDLKFISRTIHVLDFVAASSRKKALNFSKNYKRRTQ